MAINPNILLGIQQPQVQAEDPIGRYAKIMALQNGMGQQQLQGIQTQVAQRGLDRNMRLDALLQKNPNATNEEIFAVDPETGIKIQKARNEAAQSAASTNHLNAQTSDITAGHLAGAFAALARGNGSDESVSQVEQMMSPYMGPNGAEKAKAVSAQLLAMPPEQRLAFAVSQAGTHKTGQEALKLFFPAAHMQDTGGVIQPVNTSTIPGGAAPGSVVPGGRALVKTATPGEVLTDQRTRSEGAANRGNSMEIAKMNDSRTREMNGILADGSLSPEGEQMAQAIAGGQLAPLSGYALNRPGGRALMGRVMQINPQFNGADFGTNQKALKDFATGKQGNSVRSFNVALSHLDTLDQLSDALNNKDTQAINRIGNFVATQTGAAAPVNFEAAKKIVGDEIVKAIVGSGGGVGDREEAAKTISAASSPAQLKGVIATYKELMRGQLGGLRQQYEQTTGRQDFDKFLSDSGKAQEHSAPAPTGAPIKIKGDDGYNALPKGAHYVGPDGIPRIK